MSLDNERQRPTTSADNLPPEFLTRLLDISSQLIISLDSVDRNRLWDSVTTQIRTLFNCELASLFWVDEANPEYLVLHSQDPPPTQLLDLRLRIASESGHSITSHAAHNSQTIMLDRNELRLSPYIKDHSPSYLESGHYSSALFTPIQDRKGRLAGLLRLNNKSISGNPDNFTRTDQCAIELVAKQIGASLEHMRNHDALRRPFEDIPSAGTTKAAAQCVAACALKLLRGDFAKLALWSPKTKRLLFAGSVTRSENIASNSEDEQPISADSVMSALWNTSITAKAKKEVSDNSEIWIDFGSSTEGATSRCQANAKSSISAVLRVHGQPVGVLHVESFRLNDFDETDRQLLWNLCKNVSVAVQSMSNPRRLQNSPTTTGSELLTLGESEGLFQSLIANIPLPIWRKDVLGHFTWVNDAFCDEVGKHREVIIGRTDAELFPKHLADRFAVGDRKALDGDSYEDFEEPFESPKGETRYIHVIKYRILDLLGNVSGTQGMFLKSAPTEIEWALRDPDSRYLARVKDVSLPVFCLDTDLKLSFANTAYMQREGYESFNEIAGLNDVELFGRLGESYHKDNTYVLRAEKVLDKVEYHQSRDGNATLVRVIKFPIRNEHGIVRGIQCVFWDYENQERAKAELSRALEDARAEYRQIVSQASQGIFQASLNGLFVSANPAMCRLLDCESEEELLKWVGGGLKRFANDAERKDYFAAIRDAIPKVPVTFAYQLRTKKGRECWVSESVQKGIDLKGNEQVIGFVEDITERKKDTEKIENALKEKENLLTMLSHQLRTPVWQAYERANFLVNQLDPEGLLAVGQAPHPVPRIATIRGLTRKTRGVAWSIGMMSKLAQTGDVTLGEIKPIAPRYLQKIAREAAQDVQLIRRVSESFSKRMIRKQNVPNFTVESVETFAWISLSIAGDLTLIEQAVSNVIENAFKYSMPSSTIKILSFLEYKTVTLTIRNHPLPGLEIDDYVIEKCRTQYWRSKGAEMMDADGTGLGLWLVDRIMLAHKGELRVQKTDSEGWNSVVLSFPLSP